MTRGALWGYFLGMSVLILLLIQALAQAPLLDRYLEAEKAYAANPKSEARLVALVSVLYENQQNDRAIALLQPFVKSNPRAARARLFLALGYAREEKYEQARSLAAQVATELPSDYYAHHILGLSLAGLNDFDKAAEQFQKAIALQSDFADSYYELGVLYGRNAETLEKAKDNFQRALQIGYPHAEIYKNLASTNIKLGNYSEAIDDLNKALALRPDYPDAYFQLADAYRKAGRPEEAAEATRKFQALNSAATGEKQRQMKSQGSYEQGMNLLNKDDMAGAYTAFQNAAAITPEFDAALYRMAQLEYLRDDSGQALEHIRRAIALNPLEAEYYFVLSRCLENTDVPAAIDAARKAAALNPGVADFHNTLGNLLEKTGDHAGAVQSYRHAVDLDPKNEAFRMNLSAAQRRLP